MKIVFSTDQIYLHGGLEKVLSEKANWFADVYGYEVFILTTEQKSLPPCYTLSTKVVLLDLGIDYYRKSSYFHPKNLIKAPSHFLKWKKAIKKIGPDVLISCNYAFDFYWIPFFFKSIPKLKEFHSSRYFENQLRKQCGFIKRWHFKLNDFIESKFTRLVVLNPDEVSFYPTNNVVVIPNPVKKVTEKTASLTAKRAIAAGRVFPVKGFDVMISVWREVVNFCPDWELHIYGDGDEDYLKHLNQAISVSNLNNHVFIHAATKTLDQEMLQSSLYLMTSKTECYPMVLIEALSLGLPVVSFDCPTGPRHIVKNQITGFVTPYEEVKLIAQQVIVLIQNDALRKQLGSNAVVDAISFQPDHVMPLWNALFYEIKSSIF